MKSERGNLKPEGPKKLERLDKVALSDLLEPRFGLNDCNDQIDGNEEGRAACALARRSRMPLDLCALPFPADSALAVARADAEVGQDYLGVLTGVALWEVIFCFEQLDEPLALFFFVGAFNANGDGGVGFKAKRDEPHDRARVAVAVRRGHRDDAGIIRNGLHNAR